MFSGLFSNLDGCISTILIDGVVFFLLLRISCRDWKERKIGRWEVALLIGLGLIRNGGFREFTANGGFAGNGRLSELSVLLKPLMQGFICAAVPELLNLIFFGLKGLGGGDIWLMFAAGCLLGGDGGWYAMLAAGILALFYMAADAMIGKESIRGRKIAYGPFLSLGIALVLVGEYCGRI